MKEYNDKESVKGSTNDHKLEITIPFQWEDRPGAPKKDWTAKKREFLPSSSPLPAKYVASVPFKWEEKPGTPLRCFTKESNGEDMNLEKKCLPLPPRYYAKKSSYDYDYGCNYGCDYGYDYDNDYVYEYDDSWMWDFEVSKSEKNESYNSSPCFLLANGLVPKEMISCAVPLDSKNKLEQVYMNGVGKKECDSDSDSEVKKVSEEARVVGSLDDKDMKVNGVIRRPPTLGELIMLSRRRSFRRKEIDMRRRNTPKENFEENKLKGCLNLGAYEGIAKLRKDLLRLNLA